MCACWVGGLVWLVVGVGVGLGMCVVNQFALVGFGTSDDDSST